MITKRVRTSLHKISLLLLILLAVLAPVTGYFPFTVRAAGAEAGSLSDTAWLDFAATESDAVITGTVIEQNSYWNNDNTAIYTSVTLKADDILKGDIDGDVITVIYAGGVVGGTGQWQSDMPRFEAAEKTMLFLNRIPAPDQPANGTTGGYFSLYGGCGGKFPVTGDKASGYSITALKERFSRPDVSSIESRSVTLNSSADGAFPGGGLPAVIVPFSFSGNSWLHPPSPEVHIRINENTADTEGEGAAVQAAAATWSAAGANFAFIYDGPTAATGYSANGVNEIFWGTLTDGTLAVTCVWYNPATSVITECDLQFNDNYNWSAADTPTSAQYDIQTLALHELGHFLMLNDLYDSTDRNKAMYGVGITGITKRTLHAGDIAGIKDVYGTAVTAPSPATGSAAGITTISARLNGNIISTGHENPSVHIYWGPADGTNIAADWAYDISLGVLAAGAFFIDINGLSPGATYYYRSYASNSAGETWADTSASFTTLTSLTITVNGLGTTVPAEGSYTYNAGSDITITATPAVNWEFVDWDGDVRDSVSAATSVTMNTDKAVNANFKRVYGTLNLSVAGSGDVLPASGNLTYPAGSSVNLIAIPSSGWRFTNWSGDISNMTDYSAANTTILVNDDYSITANFDRPTLSVSVNGSGITTPVEGNFDYNMSSNVTVTAEPSANWVFDSWAGDVYDSSSANTSIILDKDKTITANFLRTHGDLAITVYGSGNITPDAGTYNYAAGADVNIVAVPLPGFQFISWTGDVDTIADIASANTTITINGDYAITANFMSAAYPDSIVWTGGSNGGAAAPDKTVTGLRLISDDNGHLFDNISATSYDALAVLYLPPGTAAQNINGYALPLITILDVINPPAPQPEAILIGTVYEFGPAGASFSPAAPLTITYYEKSFPEGVTEDMLCLALWDEAAGAYIPLDFEIDTVKNTVTAHVSHFSRYTLLAVPKPAAFTLSGLDITPGTVYLGDSVDVSISVANTGDLSGNYTCGLGLDNVIISSQDITLAAGEQRTLTFTFAAENEGLNNVSAGELSGSYNVILKPASFHIGRLAISHAEVETGQNVTVSVTASNSGQASGVYEVALNLNGALLDTQEVSLDGGASREVLFYITGDTAGEKVIDVNGLTGSFTVKEPPVPAATQISPTPTAVIINTHPVMTTDPAVIKTAPASILNDGTAAVIGAWGLAVIISLSSFIWFFRLRKRAP